MRTGRQLVGIQMRWFGKCPLFCLQFAWLFCPKRQRKPSLVVTQRVVGRGGKNSEWIGVRAGPRDLNHFNPLSLRFPEGRNLVLAKLDVWFGIEPRTAQCETTAHAQKPAQATTTLDFALTTRATNKTPAVFCITPACTQVHRAGAQRFSQAVQRSCSDPRGESGDNGCGIGCAACIAATFATCDV